MRFRIGIIFLLVSFITCSSYADSQKYDKCLLEEMKKSGGSESVDDIRSRCSKYLDEPATGDLENADNGAPVSVVEKRLEKEAETIESAFVLTPHRQNYILPYTYNPSRNPDPFGVKRDDVDNEEIKFQISLKYLLLDRLIKGNGDLYIAYTNQSYWQAYNSDASSPFRETNHEPEAWLQFRTPMELAGFRLSLLSIGMNHQSNGRGEELSRSWNRIMMNLIAENGNWVISLKPWYRIPEDDKDDNNPSIEKYVGYGELRSAYKWKEHVFSMMLRNNFRQSDNMGAVELGWSFPLYKKVKGYFQYFNGYCESLVDYDSSANRFGVGIMLSDIL